jgi:hypothetical protein
MRHSIVTLACMCCGLSPVSVFANTARIGAYVIDDISLKPLAGATIRGGFGNDNGWLAWTQSAPINEDFEVTDEDGRCWVKGETNKGRAGCSVRIPPEGYYRPCQGIGFSFTKKSLSGDWLPDNLVATIRLQRVEFPIPLFVKKVERRNYSNGLFREKGPDGVLRFDMVKGDWLPPDGNGETCDLEISSRKVVTGKDRKYRYASHREEDVFFFDFTQTISLGSNDCLSVVGVDPFAGIKIRTGSDVGHGQSIVREMGARKQVGKYEWQRKRYKDYDEARCYTFRIRSRYDENGNLVEAYYGKIYGDFDFECREDKGLTTVRFLYYLNLTPLDKNLEWDMKTNLCPDPGWLNNKLP